MHNVIIWDSIIVVAIVLLRQLLTLHRVEEGLWNSSHTDGGSFENFPSSPVARDHFFGDNH